MWFRLPEAKLYVDFERQPETNITSKMLTATYLPGKNSEQNTQDSSGFSGGATSTPGKELNGPEVG